MKTLTVISKPFALLCIFGCCIYFIDRSLTKQRERREETNAKLQRTNKSLKGWQMIDVRLMDGTTCSYLYAKGDSLRYVQISRHNGVEVDRKSLKDSLRGRY